MVINNNLMQDYIITPDGTEIAAAPANGQHYSLSELQSLIGGYIELVVLPDRKANMIMVIDEEGKLKGLPRNDKATALVAAQLDPNDYIVGTVLVCHSDHID